MRSGLSAALVAAPLCVSYGLMTYAPLGPAYASAGMAAALLAGMSAPVVCAALGMRAPQILMTRNVSNVVLAAFLGEFAAMLSGRVPPLLAAQAVLLFVFLTGMLELLFSTARIGTLAKFLPAPVMIGFQCGVAVVLLFLQTRGILGLDHAVGWHHLPEALNGIRPLAPVVALTTLLVADLVSRYARRAPAFLIALIAGTLMQQLLFAAGAGNLLGGTIGALEIGLPKFEALSHLTDASSMALFWPLLPTVLGWALTAAVIILTDALINYKLLEELTDQHINANTEMQRVGAANIIGACLGALHAGLSNPATIHNVSQGGRHVHSSLFAALGVFILAVVLAPVFSLLPMAAVSGMLVMVALRMFDPWTVSTLGQLLRGKRVPDRDVLGMLATVVIVSGLALFWNFLLAVCVGLSIAAVSFLWRMSRSIIRRQYTGRDLQSRNVRAPQLRDALLQHGDQIVVFELEGPLFFGTGEKLVAQLDALLSTVTRCVIVDMKRVNNVDTTGARLLAKAASRLRRKDKTLLIAGLPAGGRIAQMLASLGLLHSTATPAGSLKLFQDTDQALEWAEDRLLVELGQSGTGHGPIALRDVDMLRGFEHEEIALMSRYLVSQSFAAGSIVFRAGDEGNALYTVESGRASVILEGTAGDTRLLSFSAGAFFGEIALLDHKPRSATVRADTELRCQMLRNEDFERLQHEHPACAIKLLTNLGRELSARLRNNNITIQSLGL